MTIALLASALVAGADDGKLVQKLWFTEARGGWTELPGHYQPAYFGTGVKIHAIRYRQVPPDAGFEEYVR